MEVAIFSSSSTVTGCLDMLEGRLDLMKDVYVACIGPITAQAATDAGLHVDLVSDVQTIDGMMDALREQYDPQPKGAPAYA